MSTTIETTTKRGRKQITTPNYEFPPVRVISHGDGTATYKIRWNDENGKRHEKLEVRPVKSSRRGRVASSDANKVFTIKQSRLADSGNLKLEVPYNDENGERQTGTVTVSVNKKGKLSFTLV